LAAGAFDAHGDALVVRLAGHHGVRLSAHGIGDDPGGGLLVCRSRNAGQRGSEY